LHDFIIVNLFQGTDARIVGIYLLNWITLQEMNVA